MLSNYYLVLGIAPDANPSQVRRAFRQKSHTLHPERTGAEEESFLDTAQAHAILSDPVERARYDREFASEPQRGSVYRAIRHSPIDILRDFENFVPSMEEIVDHFRRNFEPHREPKVHHVRDLNIEVVLSPAEVEHGGRLSLAVPIFKPCRTCAGTGRAGLARCDDCAGAGTHHLTTQVDVLIPPHTPHGTVIPVSLSHLGIRNLMLQVHVRTTP